MYFGIVYSKRCEIDLKGIQLQWEFRSETKENPNERRSPRVLQKVLHRRVHLQPSQHQTLRTLNNHSLIGYAASC